ncbi:metallophosphoesterase family protein [Pseudoflavonifractor phocaeensis]|uniref:metallophosphoesterase family protein n=1 Tax=Pseudoflavonifractor phocaeensis TaxID=1870988 RepID=UPI001F463F5F|nr:YfcE family phosphodiesterase [Pseudoflavonifractor phocaeensis]MCF2596108.1 YfcE family phosphodiesterase [Pseudoflavonifractor phocaeensis]
MKILVFSDSHRSRGGMLDAIDAHRPDQVIHLGDLQSDAEELTYVYPKLPICMVPGNCDGWTMAPLKKQITLAGKRILLSHGHLWGVKKGYEAAVADARAVGADILLFGHTHRALCQQLEDGLWMMNPGASRTSYGLIRIEQGQIHCSIHLQP